MNGSEAAESHVELELVDSNSSSLAKVGYTKENVASEAFAESEVIKAAPVLGANIKKPYSKPVVKLYGTVGTVTTVVSNSSFQNDGGTGTMNKTH